MCKVKVNFVSFHSIKQHYFIIHQKEANTTDAWDIYNLCHIHLKISLHFPIRNALMAQASWHINYDKQLLIHSHKIPLSFLYPIYH